MFKPYHWPLTLQMAAKINDVEFIKRNIAEIKNQDHLGRTGLMYSAYYKNPECSKLLLEEAKMTDINGMTALMLACRKNNVETAKLLLATEARMMDSSGTTALMQAAFEGAIDCVGLLLPIEGGMVSPKDGRTALMCAAMRGHYDCVKLLADLEITKRTTDYGLTALMLCAKSIITNDENKLKCLKQLIGREAELLDKQNFNAFDYIAHSDKVRPNTESYKYLRHYIGESGNLTDEATERIKKVYTPMITERIF